MFDVNMGQRKVATGSGHTGVTGNKNQEWFRKPWGQGSECSWGRAEQKRPQGLQGVGEVRLPFHFIRVVYP